MWSGGSLRGQINTLHVDLASQPPLFLVQHSLPPPNSPASRSSRRYYSWFFFWMLDMLPSQHSTKLALSRKSHARLLTSTRAHNSIFFSISYHLSIIHQNSFNVLWRYLEIIRWCLLIVDAYTSGGHVFIIRADWLQRLLWRDETRNFRDFSTLSPDTPGSLVSFLL